MPRCYLVDNVTLVAAPPVSAPTLVTAVATGRALIFVDDDGTISGVVEASGTSGSRAAIEAVVDIDKASCAQLLREPMSQRAARPITRRPSTRARRVR